MQRAINSIIRYLDFVCVPSIAVNPRKCHPACRSPAGAKNATLNLLLLPTSEYARFCGSADVNRLGKSANWAWFISPELLGDSLLDSISLLIAHRVVKLQTLIRLDLLNRDLRLVNYWYPVVKQKKLRVFSTLKWVAGLQVRGLPATPFFPNQWLELESRSQVVSHRAHNSKAGFIRVVDNIKLVLSWHGGFDTYFCS